MVKEMKVYVTAIWWTGSDPFLHIIGNSSDKVHIEAERAMLEAARDAEEDDTSNLHWNGVSSMNLKDVIADYEIPSLEPDYTNLCSGDREAILYVG